MLTRRMLAEAWVGLTPGTLVRVALVLMSLNAIGIVPTLPSQRAGITWGPYVVAFLAMQMKGFAVFMLVLVADRISAARRFALWPYAAAIVLGVGAGTILLWLVTQRLLQIPTAISLKGGLAYEPFLAFTYRHSNGALIIFTLATAVHVLRQRGLRSRDALHASKARRAYLERELLTARLFSVRARIEPASIVAALTDAERLYESDPAAGAQAVQALARHLRGALAETRDLVANPDGHRLSSS